MPLRPVLLNLPTTVSGVTVLFAEITDLTAALVVPSSVPACDGLGELVRNAVAHALDELCTGTLRGGVGANEYPKDVAVLGGVVELGPMVIAQFIGLCSSVKPQSLAENLRSGS